MLESIPCQYSLDDLMTDLTEPDSFYAIYTLPDIKEEMQRYIEELIDRLRDGRK